MEPEQFEKRAGSERPLGVPSLERTFRRGQRNHRCVNLEVTACDLKIERATALCGVIRMHKDISLISPERIERSILLIKSHKVMLDVDLAALYGVETKQLIQAVKRNIFRFPSDFMFQLSKEEFENLRSHFGTSSSGEDAGTRPTHLRSRG